MGLQHQEAAIMAANYERVTQATFGHLAPVKNTTYRGIALFCKSSYSKRNNNSYRYRS